jgi:cellulose synthase/poly-beta-1,6-N-acetylglucosamine synthase-like glycosyltransferase
MDTMLSDWIYWISSLHANELLLLLSPILLADAPRYALGSVLLWVQDWMTHVGDWFAGRSEPARFTQSPEVCVIIAGLNEADCLALTLESLLGTYPHMHIVVVDDGSTDGMSQIANSYARRRNDITVVTMPERGGKSSALNAALAFTSAEILVCVDSDSHLGDNAIWEIVQPFADPRVGAVSGSVMVRNPTTNLITRLQALEYLRCIFIGRMFTSRLGILGIVSGAFGAYRREVIAAIGAWDVGPGEDGDLSLRVRRAGYEVVFAPYAQCFTTPVATWKGLTKQRRRWEWAVITLEMRKHLDLANPLQKSFRLRNLLMLLDRWMYSVILQYCFLFYLLWLCVHLHDRTLDQFLLYYAVYLGFEIVQLLVLLYYCGNRLSLLRLVPIAPLMPFYYLYMRFITLWAVSEELIHRRSYKDGFVPEHVRLATWHW